MNFRPLAWFTRSLKSNIIRRPNSYRPGVEELEIRELMAATLTAVNDGPFMTPKNVRNPSRAADLALSGFRPVSIISRYDHRRDAAVRTMRHFGTTV